MIIRCPYCSGVKFEIDAPVSGEHPSEIVCLPYTRDIGRFDPKKGELHGSWSEIGRDFFSEVFGYERIGILRWYPGIRVFYRVCRCPSCDHLFDVYANYTTDRNLDKIWPHLFIYRNIIRHNNYSLLILLMLLGLSFVPRLLESGGFLNFLLQNWSIILTRSLGVLVYILIRVLLIQMVEMIGSDRRFENLFQIKVSGGLDYWRNYTICRFTGVNRSRFFNLSQVSIIAGYPSVFVLILMFLSRTVEKYHHLGKLVFLEILWYAMIGFLVGSLGKIAAKESSVGLTCKNNKNLIKLFIKIFFPIHKYGIIGCIAGLCIWMVFTVFPVINRRDLLINIDDFSSLVLWAIIAYSLGVGTWGVMETVLYVLRGVRRIPMNIDPHNNYRSLAVLDDFALKSSKGMGFLFAFVIIVLSLSFDEKTTWLVDWIQIGLLGLIFVISLALGGKIRYFFILLIFIYIFGLFMFFLLENQIYSLYNPKIFLIALILIFIFFFHSREVIKNLRFLREKSLENWLIYYENQINYIEKQFRLFDRRLNVYSIYDFAALTLSLEKLLSLRRTIVDFPTSPMKNIYQRTLAIFGLLLTSVVPVLVEVLVTRWMP